MPDPLPSLALIKAQAKRLRASLAEQGRSISHSQALELIAAHHGYRDWNTLCAVIKRHQPSVAVGQMVEGFYLGQAVSGRVHSIEPDGLNRWRLRLQLDAAVDVVASERFSGWRRHIQAVIDGDGRTEECLSSGEAVLRLTLPTPESGAD